VDVDPYRIFRSAFASKSIRSAWAKSYGDQFWEASDPPLSQATIDDIKCLTQRLAPGTETKLADLGCGSGCVGRYLAKEFSTHVEGIDANPLATRLAEELAASSEMTQFLVFKTGDITNTGWGENYFDGAFSMDVLLFVADKRAALKEVARILKPGGASSARAGSCVTLVQRCPLRPSKIIPARSRMQASSSKFMKRPETGETC